MCPLWRHSVVFSRAAARGNSLLPTLVCRPYQCMCLCVLQKLNETLHNLRREGPVSFYLMPLLVAVTPVLIAAKLDGTFAIHL